MKYSLTAWEWDGVYYAELVRIHPAPRRKIQRRDHIAAWRWTEEPPEDLEPFLSLVRRSLRK